MSQKLWTCRVNIEEVARQGDDELLDDLETADIKLPFIPFVNLWVRAPQVRLDYVEVLSIYWDDEENRFDLMCKATMLYAK